MSHRCFQRTRYSSGETVITLQLQIKISLEGCNTKYPNSRADPLTLRLKKSPIKSVLGNVLCRYNDNHDHVKDAL